jgi:hypothetical protein
MDREEESRSRMKRNTYIRGFEEVEGPVKFSEVKAAPPLLL